MNLDELKKHTQFLENENLTVELFFLFRVEDEISIKRAQIETEIQNDISKDIIAPYIKKELNTADDIIAYDPSINPDRKSLFEVSANEVEQYQLAMTDIENIDDFSHADGYEDIWGYMVKISQGENEIITIRKCFSSHFLKKGFSLWNQNGQFVRFDNKVFTLDRRVDAILINGRFVIFQRTNFEQCFIYNVQLERQAKRNAKDIIEKYELLEVSDEQLESFLDKQSISKLRKIDMSLIEDGTMCYTNLDRFCDGLGIQVERNDLIKKFVPSNKKEFKIFVKLLADDYLKSGLTGRDYDTHSKEVLSSN